MLSNLTGLKLHELAGSDSESSSDSENGEREKNQPKSTGKLLYPPQTLFVVGYTVFTLSVRPSVRASVRPCVRPSVTFCFLNILKSQCWNFIKLCKHINICKTNTFNKKGKGYGPILLELFPFVVLNGFLYRGLYFVSLIS